MTIKTRNIADSAVTAAKIASGAVTVSKLSSTMQLGTIQLPLNSWRITDNANTDVALVAATAVIGSGGVGGIDAEPALKRVNAATDKKTRIEYLDGKLDPIFNDFVIPADCDVASGLTFKVTAAMSGTNNNTTILTLVWVGVKAGAYAAGSDQGGATSAFGATATTLVTKSVAIAAAAINAPGTAVSVELTPTSPGTDALHIYATWVEYTRI